MATDLLLGAHGAVRRRRRGFADTPGPWGDTRVVYLQHGSDPVVFFSPSLAWGVPDWLLDGQRAPDVSPADGAGSRS